MQTPEIKVLFLDKNQIRQKADLFRQKFWGEAVPVDIEKIIDVGLRINIIPLPNLRRDCDVDAQISFNFEEIYVDYDMFKDERQRNRLRFSFAHELGHSILHRYIYTHYKPTNVYRYRQIILEQMPERQYSYLETQANKFAGYLLVPRERLTIEKNKLLNQLQKDPEFIKMTDEKIRLGYLALKLSNIFGVSSEVMEIVLGENEN